MGLSSMRISEPMRRDRLLLISAFATLLLTLLGAVGEHLGMDRLLKSNTSSGYLSEIGGSVGEIDTDLTTN